MHAYGTTVEGECEAVFAALRACHERVHAMGAPRISTSLRLGTPRFVRGSQPRLSKHAYGSAIDLNAEWNRLATVPALKGKQGSVRELVPLANRHGIYWDGHFKGRADGMHFELARTEEGG